VSSSNAVDALVQGGLLPCTTPPSFAGLATVTNPGDCQRLVLNWPPATSNCYAGQGISYNIYRGTTATFTPGAGNRIATGVVGNPYIDASGSAGTYYYYVARAEDSTTGHGGPANGGNEDTNTVRRAGYITSAELIAQGYSDDMETGPDNQSSTHFHS